MQCCPSRPGGGGGREPNAARVHSPVTRAKFVHVSGLYCGRCLCLSDGNLRINVAVVLIAGVERASRLFCLEMCQSGRSACVRQEGEEGGGGGKGILL